MTIITTIIMTIMIIVVTLLLKRLIIFLLPGAMDNRRSKRDSTSRSWIPCTSDYVKKKKWMSERDKETDRQTDRQRDS